jgi:ribosomal protein S18 acetylase RimI-like enzyme
MTKHENRSHLMLHIPVTFRRARYSDLEKLECFGQFTYLRAIFQRSYLEQKSGNRFLLIADMNGYPIGRLFIQFQSNNPVVSDGHTRAYLYSFYVMDMFRGQGIGTRCMQIAETLLQRKGFQIATIAVAKDNSSAMRLYQRLGYQIFDENDGKWQYRDHQGELQVIHEPSWLLEKRLIERKRSKNRSDTNP